jgi:hypothetical protein
MPAQLEAELARGGTSNSAYRLSPVGLITPWVSVRFRHVVTVREENDGRLGVEFAPELGDVERAFEKRQRALRTIVQPKKWAAANYQSSANPWIISSASR